MIRKISCLVNTIICNFPLNHWDFPNLVDLYNILGSFHILWKFLGKIKQVFVNNSKTFFCFNESYLSAQIFKSQMNDK